MIVLLFLIFEPIRLRRIGERYIKVLVELVVDREVVTPSLDGSFASSVLLSELIKVCILARKMTLANRAGRIDYVLRVQCTQCTSF